MDVPAGLTVSGNAAALQTVFDNLVENGLRYAASYIRMELTGEEEGGKVVLQYLPHELVGQYFEVVE